MDAGYGTDWVLWVLASFDDRRFPKGERKALWCARRCIPLAPRGIDAPTTARKVGLPPRGGKYFLSARKKVPKKARGTATPEAARPAARYSQISAFRALPCPALVFAQACQSLTAYGSCAHWARAPSRPKLRPAGALRAVLCLGSLCSPAVGAGQTQIALLGMIRRGAADFAR